MITRYKLTSKKILGAFNLQFKEGYLIGVKMEFKTPLNQCQHAAFFGNIPLLESDLEKLTESGLKVAKENPREGQTKVGMFCDKYMEHHDGRKYKATVVDGRRIKEFKITNGILDAYFRSINHRIKDSHSIGNMLTYWNELMQEMENASKSKFPDHWNEKYEAKLNQQQLSEYWAHLRSLGLVAKKDRVGKTIDWVKQEHYF
jgi:hypothetical protein